MPYRRLPNTDAARIAALEKAVGMEYRQTSDYHPASFKTLNEARVLLPRFKAAVTQFRFQYDELGKCNKRHHPLAKTARLYISHFIQVLNMTVVRKEIKAELKQLYGLCPDDFSVPDLTCEQAVEEWGKRIIDGENARLARHGGTPIYNPTIAKVKVHYDLFVEARYNRNCFKQQMQRSLQQLDGMRTEADILITKIWNEVESYFSDYSDDARMTKCKEYGIIYYYRKNEKLSE